MKKETQGTTRYTLTVNAFSPDVIKHIEESMADNEQAGKHLAMDHCFGPSAFDGSYLAIFSSDSLAPDGLVSAWSFRNARSFFSQLSNKLRARFTLKEYTDDDEKPDYCKVWGSTAQ